MERRVRERIFAFIMSALFLVSFGSVLYLDRSHGDFGDRIGEDEVKVDVMKNQGHLTLPPLPQELLIFASDGDTKLDLSVENNDPDNDIDTIFVTVPNATMIAGSSTWYTSSIAHEWTYNSTDPSEARFDAKDDLPGRVFGGSEQYDVAGNIDDALDYNEQPLVKESLTLTVDFKAPETPGTKVGSKGIQLEVADLKTEMPGSPRRLVEPFPYPFVVIDVDYEFIIYELISDSCDLEVVFGNTTLFSRTRAISFDSSEHGFKFTSGTSSVAVLDAPTDGTLVKPIIRARQADASGTFVMNAWWFNTLTIDPQVPKEGWVEALSSVSEYEGQVPASPSQPLDVDIDGDMVFNDDDPDIDGDGIDNADDTSPYDPNIRNRHPVINLAYAAKSTINEAQRVEISVDAEDPDQDALTFTWTVNTDPNWIRHGSDVEVSGFTPGVHIFTINVTDGKGGFTKDTVTLTVTEKPAAQDRDWIIYAALIVIVLLIVIGVVYYLVKGRTEEEEQPMEMAPEGEVAAEEAAVEEMAEEGMPEMEGVAPPTMEAVEEVLEEEEEEIMIEEKAPPPPVVSAPPVETESKEVQDLEQLITEMEKDEEVGDTCPECSSPLGPYDTECPNCGAQFDIALECPNCGAVVDSKASQCSNCGVTFQ